MTADRRPQTADGGRSTSPPRWIRKQMLLAIAIFFAGITQSFSQQVPAGVSYETWERMGKRWESYMSWATVELKDGSTVSGQVTWANDTEIALQLNRAIPVFPADPSGFMKIRVAEIKSIRLIRGGHPYQGLILGALTGAVPGVVTGLILAQGWTIIPAIVLGTVTAGGGGWIGTAIQRASRKENIEILTTPLETRQLALLEKSALFPGSPPEGSFSKPSPSMDIIGFEKQIPSSKKLQKAFPDNSWSLSVQTGLLTSDVRKKLQNWFLVPMLGPPTQYYETRIFIQADVTRRIGNRFQAGALFNLVPGDISYSYFSNYLPEYGVSYDFNHIFKQTIFGLFGGYMLQPSDRFLSHRFRGSIQAGPVLSDIYEHFYYQWSTLDYTRHAGKLTQVHIWKPGAFLRLKAEYFLIPGLSLTFGAQGFWIQPVRFENRTIVPESVYGPIYVTMHKLNFSSWQWLAGFSINL